MCLFTNDDNPFQSEVNIFGKNVWKKDNKYGSTKDGNK